MMGVIQWLQGIGCRFDFVIDPGEYTIHADTRDILFKVLDLHIKYRNLPIKFIIFNENKYFFFFTNL